jgi:hypothetical protein
MKTIKTINLSEFAEQSRHSIHDIKQVFTYFPVNGEILRIYEHKRNLYIDVLQTSEASLHKVVFELYKRDENINDASLTDYVGYVDERYIFMRK